MPFSNAALHPGTRKKRMLENCLLQPVFAKSGSFSPQVTWWYFACIKWRKALCGVAYFISAEKVFYCVISRYCWPTVLRSKSGAVVRALASHQKQCGLGSNPGVGACRLSLLSLVLSLSPRGFSPVFLSLKTTTSEFQSVRNTRTRFSELLRTPKCKFPISRLTIFARDTTQRFRWAVTRTLCMFLFSVTVQHFTVD